MNLKLVVAISVLAAMPALAQQPPGGPPQRPSKADWQKAIQVIGGDKAKAALFCEIQDLTKKAAEINQKLGRDNEVLDAAMGMIDPASAEGQELKSSLAKALPCK